MGARATEVTEDLIFLRILCALCVLGVLSVERFTQSRATVVLAVVVAGAGSILIIPPGRAVDGDIQQPVRPLSHVADALFECSNQRFATDGTALGEHDALQV